MGYTKKGLTPSNAEKQVKGLTRKGLFNLRNAIYKELQSRSFNDGRAKALKEFEGNVKRNIHAFKNNNKTKK